jgi:dihydroxyacid dehydratase/phosphogluconate dehydratase
LLHLAPLPIFRHTAGPMKKKSSGKKSRNTQHATRNSMRPFSSILVDGPERAAARAMLYPVGFTEDDFKKPIIGIASTWSNVTPCNHRMLELKVIQ